MARYRRGSSFVRPADVARPIDRNQAARLMHLAEALERRTKAGRIGALGLTGLQVLRALLRFRHSATGVCTPSYASLQRATGFCRATIAACLDRLEHVGILTRARRVSWAIVAGRRMLLQDVNAYAFAEPSVMPQSVERLRRAFPRPESGQQGGSSSKIDIQPIISWRTVGDWRDRARQLMTRASERSHLPR